MKGTITIRRIDIYGMKYRDICRIDYRTDQGPEGTLYAHTDDIHCAIREIKDMLLEQGADTITQEWKQ